MPRGLGSSSTASRAVLGRRLLAALVALVLALAGCSAAKQPVRIEVSPAATRMDEPFATRVSGLQPGATVDLALRSTDAQGTTWASRATFVADGSGDVDPGTAAPTAGSYQGVDGMGLVSSLQPQGNALSYRWPDLGPVAFDLSVEQDGRPLATARVERTLWQEQPKITTFTMAKDGFVGTYYRPAGVQRGPAVLFLGGSEGGNPSGGASRFAARGIPSLSVAYFRAEGLPQTLSRIPLEYFDAPLRWLAAQPEVDPGRLWISGGSRGSEAAGLVASDHPDLVHGLLDLSPSSRAGCSYDPAAQDPCPGPAWTRNGKAVAHTRLLNGADDLENAVGAIPVEKIDGPVLTLCGKADQLWSSCAFSDAIQARLSEHRFAHPTLALVYPDAGHAVDGIVPYQPLSLAAYGSLPVYGVTPLANDLARADAWPKILAFVRQ